MDEARWLTEADVVATVALDDAVAAIRAALLLEHEGHAHPLAKAAVEWGGGHTLHALGGVVAERGSDDLGSDGVGSDGLGVAGAKVWAHTAGGAEPVVVLWDAAGGRLLAVLEAFALGQLRTAATSAIAIDELAAEDATTLAIIGSGKQATAQVAAARWARPLRDVRVFSPTPEHRHDLARRLAVELDGCTVRACDSVAAAVAGAQIVTTATRARHPFLDPTMLDPDALVVAIGAITPERAELDPAVAADAALVVSDSPQTALALSAELAAAPAVIALSAVVAGAAGADVSGGRRLFKAMGLGLADVAVAAAALQRGRGSGPGATDPAPRSRRTTMVPSERHDMTDHSFRDVSGTAAPGEPAYWSPVIFRKAEIDAEIARLAAIPRPADGRRSSLLVHPASPAARPSLAPGIRVSLDVLLPGERTRPIRHTSTQVGFCIAGSGRVEVGTTTHDVHRYDAWNHPSWRPYTYANTGREPFVRLTYSNAPLLEAMNVHLVEDLVELRGRRRGRRRAGGGRRRSRRHHPAQPVRHVRAR